MSEITNKINKLAMQHEVIRVKADCPYFYPIGNLCSRVADGMVRCDECPECEFKYIDALKEENAILRKLLNKRQEEAEALKSYKTYEVWLNNEYRKENEKLKQQFETDKNQINYFIEENEKLKEQIKQLEDFIKSGGEIDHINHEYTYKLKKVLQEVKSIAKGIRSYLEVPTPRDVRFEMDRILDLINEAELLDQKESEER